MFAIPSKVSNLPTSAPGRRWRRGSSGFTLVELLVVLAILGLLVGLVGPQVMNALGSSKTKTARIQVSELGSALDMYHLDVGRYPSTDQGLEALVEQSGDVSGWSGPYLRKREVPKDPWGYDYQYRSPGEHGSFDLWSLGADNRAGGEGEDQDVLGWE